MNSNLSGCVREYTLSTSLSKLEGYLLSPSTADSPIEFTFAISVTPIETLKKVSGEDAFRLSGYQLPSDMNKQMMQQENLELVGDKRASKT
ncbi:hypothetical protein ACJIZ3_015015 [Penstemon smallii]|uniref:Uncharacterized protein n=1 Tax=Penstemon smallii TaxID=265156 RepID=A0ABD3RL96_9LAMI